MRILLIAAFFPATVAQGQWAFSGDSSATWQEAIARYAEFARTRSGAKLMEIGHDDGGQPMHLFVLSDGSGFTPGSIRASGKNILWITNGIHPGEPDGIDASLLLAQALLDSDQLMGLLIHTAVCIVPVYNISGAGQRGSVSRADQNGPRAYGFRGNARNLDLNRDFMKVDAMNTRSLESALAYWDPDVYFETHVSDGADHRYLMELLTAQKDKLDGGLSAFLTATMMPALYERMGRKGIDMCPYFETKKEIPDSGLVGFYDSPRYSTGFNALFDRIGILSETHVFKPFADRVNATLQLQLAALVVMNEHADELLAIRRKARVHTASMDEIGVNWKVDTTAISNIPWKGYAAGYKMSEVSGLPRLWYDRSHPVDIPIPWMDIYRAATIVRKPKAYLIPQQWREVIDRLQLNGVALERLAKDTWFTVEQDSIGAFATRPSPYEGHYLHSDIHTSRTRLKRMAHVGDVLVRMGRNTDRYVTEALEAEGEDSFFAWGFFDSALQEKEWPIDYVFEDRAAEFLRQNPSVRAQLQAKCAADPAFAKDAGAQLQYVYQHSPWFEPGFRKYPVVRVIGE